MNYKERKGGAKTAQTKRLRIAESGINAYFIQRATRNHQDTKAPREAIPEETDRVAKEIVDAAYKVHFTLGPGLLENVYEICMVHELTRRKLRVTRQVGIPIVYENIRLDAGLRLDMVADGCVVIENKVVEKLLPLHEAQLLTYLKLSGLRLGLLINFNVPLIKDGIRRIAL